MTTTDKPDIWRELAAPLPPNVIQWRQDGRPASRDGKHFARFVAFIDAQFVRERFDTVIPGEWDLTLSELPPRVTFDGEEEREPYAFKARIQVLGVIRESVGQGKDYKTAETDAFKRAAVRFGIGAELYGYGPCFVQMDGDGKYAKPLEDPGAVYARKHGRPNGPKPIENGQVDYGRVPEPQRGELASGTDEISHSANAHAAPLASDEPSCPKCGGRVWDNRLTKRNPKAPDYKCRDRSCDGVIWPPKQKKDDDDRDPPSLSEETEEIPF
jgi:hypothetical protein